MDSNKEELVLLLYDVNRGVTDFLRKKRPCGEIPFALMLFMKEVGQQPGITLSE